MKQTKNLIINTFWNILEEKPYNKITVQNLVDACEMNRNTFYYHFQDIPTLTVDSIQRWADDVIQKQENCGSPFKCIVYMAQECTKRKKALLHLYQSKQKEVFLSGLNKLGYHVILTYMNENWDKVTLSDEEKETAAHYYKCAFTGIVLDWLNQDAAYDLAAFCENIYQLRERFQLMNVEYI